MPISPSDHVIPRVQWQPPTTINWFDRNRRVALADGVIALAHPQAIRIMQSAFEPLTRNTYYISFLARQILTDKMNGKIYKEDEIFRAEQIIASEFERISDWLDQRLVQVRKRLEDAGYDSERVPREYKSYEYPSATRVITEFRQLLRKADDYLVMGHYLYIIGELSDSVIGAETARLGNERTVRGTVWSLTRKTNQQFEVIQRICRGAAQIKADARRQQAIKDKERAQRKKARRLRTEEDLRAIRSQNEESVRQQQRDEIALEQGSGGAEKGTPATRVTAAA